MSTKVNSNSVQINSDTTQVPAQEIILDVVEHSECREETAIGENGNLNRDEALECAEWLNKFSDQSGKTYGVSREAFGSSVMYRVKVLLASRPESLADRRCDEGAVIDTSDDTDLEYASDCADLLNVLAETNHTGEIFTVEPTQSYYNGQDAYVVVKKTNE